MALLSVILLISAPLIMARRTLIVPYDIPCQQYYNILPAKLRHRKSPNGVDVVSCAHADLQNVNCLVSLGTSHGRNGIFVPTRFL